MSLLLSKFRRFTKSTTEVSRIKDEEFGESSKQHKEEKEKGLQLNLQIQQQPLKKLDDFKFVEPKNVSFPTGSFFSAILWVTSSIFLPFSHHQQYFFHESIFSHFLKSGRQRFHDLKKSMYHEDQDEMGLGNTPDSQVFF
jgi:hypothetical protein